MIYKNARTRIEILQAAKHNRPCHSHLQVHRTDQVLLPTCIHSFVECGRMQGPHSPALSMT